MLSKMPIYVYAVLDESGEPIDTVELLQPITDEPLTLHPETGKPLRRLITAPNVPRKWTDSHARANMSPANLERMGFTQYTKAGDGRYEKTAGSGPDLIS